MGTCWARPQTNERSLSTWAREVGFEVAQFVIGGACLLGSQRKRKLRARVSSGRANGNGSSRG